MIRRIIEADTGRDVSKLNGLLVGNRIIMGDTRDLHIHLSTSTSQAGCTELEPFTLAITNSLYDFTKS